MARHPSPGAARLRQCAVGAGSSGREARTISHTSAAMHNAGSISGSSANNTIGTTSSAARPTKNNPNSPPNSAPIKPNVSLNSPATSAPNSQHAPTTTSTRIPSSNISISSPPEGGPLQSHIQYAPLRHREQHDSRPMTTYP